jgi:hypothetical protein
MNQHWHRGDGTEPLPNVIEKMQHAGRRRRIVDEQTGVEVCVEPGAGNYEDQFKFYWLCVAWALFGYFVISMVVLIFNMSWGGSVYVWVPHLVGTCIIISAIGFTACIYRYILFPPPGYFSRTPQDFHYYETSDASDASIDALRQTLGTAQKEVAA